MARAAPPWRGDFHFRRRPSPSHDRLPRHKTQRQHRERRRREPRRQKPDKQKSVHKIILNTCSSVVKHPSADRASSAPVARGNPPRPKGNPPAVCPSARRRAWRDGGMARAVPLGKSSSVVSARWQSSSESCVWFYGFNATWSTEKRVYFCFDSLTADIKQITSWKKIAARGFFGRARGHSESIMKRDYKAQVTRLEAEAWWREMARPRTSRSKIGKPAD